MNLQETGLIGAYLIEPEPIEDERGFFARLFDADEFESLGLNRTVAQCSISYNKAAGTLRGLHFQVAPHREVKLVRCTRGAIHDVIVDIRPDSPTYMLTFGADLTDRNRSTMYVPEGFAHGFLTLQDDTEVWYQMSEFFAPDAARGFRFDDPAFGIEWPGEVTVINERDRTYPDFVPGDGAGP